MGIKKERQEFILVQDELNNCIKKCVQALENSDFTKIVINEQLGQITAGYKKFTVWGNIILMLRSEGNNVSINVISKANVDNIFALFTSPNLKITYQFKNSLKAFYPNIS